MISKKYYVIYADPPWSFRDKFLYSSSCSFQHYPVMDLQSIKDLPIKEITTEDSLLFIWTTDAHIPDCLEVIKAWGFKYITVAFYWHKKTKNNKEHIVLGRWTLKSTEMCLLAGRGCPSYLKVCNNVRQFVEEKVGRHSQKPLEVANRIAKLVGNASRIELFARQKVEGWDVWGNEIENDIELFK